MEAIFETKSRKNQDWDTLHFFNYRAEAKTEKAVLEAYLSQFWAKNKYWTVWDIMSVESVEFTAQAIMSLESMQKIREESLAIEKPKLVTTELGIKTLIVSGDTDDVQSRPMKVEELRMAIYKHRLIEAIEKDIQNLPEMRSRLQAIRKIEQAEKAANAGISI